MTKSILFGFLVTASFLFSSFATSIYSLVDRPFSADEFVFLGMNKEVALTLLELDDNYRFGSTKMNEDNVEIYGYWLRKNQPTSKEKALILFFTSGTCYGISHIVKRNDVGAFIVWLNFIKADRINSTTWETESLIYTIKKKNEDLSVVSYTFK